MSSSRVSDGLGDAGSGDRSNSIVPSDHHHNFEENSRPDSIASNADDWWNELKDLVQLVYLETQDCESLCETRLRVSYEKTYNLVYKLCRYDVEDLFFKLYDAAQVHVETLRQEIVEFVCTLSLTQRKSALGVFGALEQTYDELCRASEVFDGAFIYLHNCFLKKFDATFGDINKGLFCDVIMADPIVQSAVPRLKGLLRKNDQVLLGYQLFERTLKDVRVHWSKLKRAFDRHHQELVREAEMREECEMLQQRGRELKESGTLGDNVDARALAHAMQEHIYNCMFCSPQAETGLFSRPDRDDQYSCSEDSVEEELYEYDLGGFEFADGYESEFYDQPCCGRSESGFCPHCYPREAAAREKLRQKLSYRKARPAIAPPTKPAYVEDERSVEELLDFINNGGGSSTSGSSSSNSKASKKKQRHRQRRKKQRDRKQKAGVKPASSSKHAPASSTKSKGKTTLSPDQGVLETTGGGTPVEDDPSIAGGGASNDGDDVRKRALGGKLELLTDFPDFWEEEDDENMDAELKARQDKEVEEFRARLNAVARPEHRKAFASVEAFEQLSKLCSSRIEAKKHSTGDDVLNRKLHSALFGQSPLQQAGKPWNDENATASSMVAATKNTNAKLPSENKASKINVH